MFKLYRVRDFIVDKWQGRFKWGVNFTGAAVTFNRYANKHGSRFGLTLGQIVSPGSNHWPFSLLDLCYISGKRSCWHVGVLGMTYGCQWKQNVSQPDEEGAVEILGPDYRKHYFFFSCINHHQKNLGDITNAN